ncbi:MAG: Fe-S cluster assembly transcriptional regulator IscR [Gammaproteobacteria bacterium]|nr:Fe-S cluster assembly transcriptional regulator IscR [Gammaproteobacteria bacterium]MDH5628587.1 Fe-S cluster assembly transcriptional regulator IscR [Gammaproteobacteria bacterium]
MRLTTKGRYAVTAMLDLAINSSDSPVNLTEISERQAISLSYLEQLFAKLRRRKLVRSIRGPGGGYMLNATTDEISVANIINAVNESMDISRCEGRANCQDGQQCLTHNLWVDLSNRINSFLDDITIGQLIRQNEEQRKLRANQNDNHKIELNTIA